MLKHDNYNWWGNISNWRNKQKTPQLHVYELITDIFWTYWRIYEDVKSIFPSTKRWDGRRERQIKLPSEQEGNCRWLCKTEKPLSSQAQGNELVWLSYPRSWSSGQDTAGEGAKRLPCRSLSQKKQEGWLFLPLESYIELSPAEHLTDRRGLFSFLAPLA